MANFHGRDRVNMNGKGRARRHGRDMAGRGQG